MERNEAVQIPGDLAARLMGDIDKMGDDAPLSLKRLWGALEAATSGVAHMDAAAIETAAELSAVAREIETHREAIKTLTPQRDALIRRLRGGCFSYREIAVFARVSHVTVGEILKAE